MNVFAHVAVAARWADPEPPDRFLLGAALSDLATFGGFRLLGRSPDPAVAAGMAFHHRTDDAFHQHPWFRSRSGAAAAALERAGLGRGAARACGHVGVELLLDGSLQAGEQDRDRFRRVLAGAGSDGWRPLLAPLVDERRRPDWLDHLDLLASPRDLPPYEDPAAVARRLHAICQRRPRLAFDQRAVDAVATELERLAGGIRDTAPELVEQLAATLALPAAPRRVRPSPPWAG